jgi:hypothetical protein
LGCVEEVEGPPLAEGEAGLVTCGLVVVVGRNGMDRMGGE